MAIPLFTGPAGSLPSTRAEDFSSAPELILRARESGANIAQTDQQTENLRQQTDLNDLRRQQAEFELQSEKELQPLKTEALRQKIAQDEAQTAAIQDKYAEEIRIKDKTQKLVGILGGADPQAKVGAVTSGQFADVFAAQPNLEKYAVSTTYPLMTPEQREGFQSQSANSDLRNYYLKQGAAVNQTYQKSLATYAENQVAKNLLQDFYKGQVALTEIPDKIDFVRSDAYETDPETGVPVFENGKLKASVIAPEGKATSYDIFDKGTGRLIQRNIDPADKAVFDAFRTNKYLVSQYDLPVANYSTQSKTVDQLSQRPAPQAAQQQVSSPLNTVPAPTPAPIPTPAPAANTPDTNQLPIDQKKAGVLGTLLNDPAKQDLYRDKMELYKKRTEQLTTGKQDASFPAAIGDTAQMFQNIEYRPAVIKSDVLERVNAEPLLAGKPPLIKALAAVESAGHRNAKSRTGVRGLLQVTESTAGQYGLDRNIPEQNVLAGEKELYRNLKLVKTPELALAAYNAGIGNVLDAVKATNSYDWDVVKGYLKDTLHPRKYKEVENYPEQVLNYAAAFATTEV